MSNPEYDPAVSVEGTARTWHPGLIITAVVALALMAIGGYGAIQQHSAMIRKISDLQALLAASATPAEIRANRELAMELERRSIELRKRIDILTLYNKSLSDVGAQLKTQLGAQQVDTAGSEAESGPTDTKPTIKSADKSIPISLMKQK
jgi:hypothetical protein